MSPPVRLLKTTFIRDLRVWDIPNMFFLSHCPSNKPLMFPLCIIGKIKRIFIYNSVLFSWCKQSIIIFMDKAKSLWFLKYFYLQYWTLYILLSDIDLFLFLLIFGSLLTTKVLIDCWLIINNPCLWWFLIPSIFVTISFRQLQAQIENSYLTFPQVTYLISTHLSLWLGIHNVTT